MNQITCSIRKLMPTKKIKIIHVIGPMGYGGAERLLLDLCRKIDKSRFDVSVLSVKKKGPLLEKFIEAGIRVEVLEKKFRLQLSLIKKIATIFEQEKPDIVHTHLFLGDFYGGTAALLAKVPVVMSTKHDIMHESWWRDFFSRKIRQRFTKIVAISQATKKFLIKNEKIPAKKIEVIYNGIDVAKFYSDGANILNDENVVLGTVGRLSKEKGQKHLIRACRFLKTKLWELLMVGNGPMLNELQRSAIMLGLQDKITFVGEVPDVRPYLEKMDIFVLPSVSEGLSLAVIEAALAGRFVIATSVGGVPEIIKDKETGLLFRPKNIEQLVGHLNWAMEHRHDAKRMAAQLQKDVLERFDINKIIFQYQKLYEKLMIHGSNKSVD